MVFGVSVMVLPVVRAWMVNRLGDVPRLGKRHEIGRVFFDIAERSVAGGGCTTFGGKRQRLGPVSVNDMVLFRCAVSEDIWLRNATVLDGAGCREFNLRVKAMLFERLFDFLDGRACDGFDCSLREMVERFYVLHGLGEDVLPFETAKKAYQRHLSRLEMARGVAC